MTKISNNQDAVNFLIKCFEFDFFKLEFICDLFFVICNLC